MFKPVAEPNQLDSLLLANQMSRYVHAGVCLGCRGWGRGGERHAVPACHVALGCQRAHQWESRASCRLRSCCRCLFVPTPSTASPLPCPQLLRAHPQRGAADGREAAPHGGPAAEGLSGRGSFSVCLSYRLCEGSLVGSCASSVTTCAKARGEGERAAVGVFGGGQRGGDGGVGMAADGWRPAMHAGPDSPNKLRCLCVLHAIPASMKLLVGGSGS